MTINIEDLSAIIDELDSDYKNRLSRYPQIFNTNDPDEKLSQNRPSPPVSYQQPLSRLGPLPRFSSIIGICEDGLPLLFDLSNPSAGSILIVGSANTGKIQLLQSFLKSTSLLNPPSDVNYYVISPEPDRYYEIASNDHCSGIFSSYERVARELVIELASLAEQRKSGRQMGSVIILAIDNLYAFLKNKEFEIDIHLKWLIRNGPNNGVWCISTLQPQYLEHVNREILVGYKTRLLSLSHSLALTTGSNSQMQFLQPDTFMTQIGNQSICFSIPVFD